MKQSIKNLGMATLVILGTILSSCEKLEPTQPEEHEYNIVVCTTTVSLDTEATKALTEHGEKTFAEGETIAVIYTNEDGETVKAVSDALPSGNYGNTASFIVSLTNPASDAAVRIIYPAAMAAKTVATNVAVDDDATINYAALGTQNGTLETLSSKLDLSVYDGTLEGTVLPANPALKNKLAICKYTLKDAAGTNDITSTVSALLVEDGTNSYRVSRTKEAGPIYVAIRPTDAATINYTATDGSNFYEKTVSGKTYQASQMYPLGLRMATTNTVNLALFTSNYTAQDGQTLTGTPGGPCQISIAAGATVTLKNVSINADDKWSGMYDGVRCGGGGNITINLIGTNTVRGETYGAGIYVPSNSTLTIQGNGTLNAIGDVSTGGAGIGGKYNDSCGNIIIAGGAINATGGSCAAGIGTGLCTSKYTRSCGYITISGGTVTATGGSNAAGIGSSDNCGCGAITISGGIVTATGGSFAPGIGSGANNASCDGVTITSGVTRVTATKGSSASYSIGAGNNSTCGTVTIGGVEGEITKSPYIYPAVPVGGIPGEYSVSSTEKVYFSKGNLQAVIASGDGYNYTASSWQFAENQWDHIGAATTDYSSFAAGSTVDLFGWVGSTASYNTYGLCTYSTTGYAGDPYYGTSDNDHLKSDWGVLAISNGGNTANFGWRTLSSTEWVYLFDTRASGATVNGTSDARYTFATINTNDGNGGVNGVLLFPDGVTIDNSEASSWGNINDKSEWGTKCTSSQWTALEDKGCVFLPVTGYRTTHEINQWWRGFYWSSSPTQSQAYRALCVNFAANYLKLPDEYWYRCWAASVRLVMDVR